MSLLARPVRSSCPRLTRQARVFTRRRMDSGSRVKKVKMSGRGKGTPGLGCKSTGRLFFNAVRDFGWIGFLEPSRAARRRLETSGAESAFLNRAFLLLLEAGVAEWV